MSSPFAFDEVRIDWTDDRPEKGMWTCGPNAGWCTATHIPTQAQVRVYGRQQYRARERAMLLLEMAVEDVRDQKASFPERIAPEQGQ